jgi:hypothetical protein
MSRLPWTTKFRTYGATRKECLSCH